MAAAAAAVAEACAARAAWLREADHTCASCGVKVDEGIHAAAAALLGLGLGLGSGLGLELGLGLGLGLGFGFGLGLG